MSDERACRAKDCSGPTHLSPVCEHDHTRLVAALGGDLAREYVELHLGLRPGTTGNDDPKTSSSKTRQLPIDTNARAAQERILAAVLGWEQALRRHMDWIPAPRRGREGPTLTAACGVLLDHLAAALRVEDAAEHADRVLRAGRGTASALGKTGPANNRIDLACPYCGDRDLVRRNGTDVIGCLCCGAVLTAQQLDDLLDPPITEEHAA